MIIHDVDDMRKMHRPSTEEVVKIDAIAPDLTMLDWGDHWDDVNRIMSAPGWVDAPIRLTVPGAMLEQAAQSIEEFSEQVRIGWVDVRMKQGWPSAEVQQDLLPVMVRTTPDGSTISVGYFDEFFILNGAPGDHQKLLSIADRIVAERLVVPSFLVSLGLEPGDSYIVDGRFDPVDP